MTWNMHTARPVIWERSGGHCEISGLALEYDTFDAHHRRPKGMGGTSRPDRDSPGNLLALHPLVHNLHPQSVHESPEWARANGYLLRNNCADPSAEPLRLHAKVWVRLDRDRPDYRPTGNEVAGKARARALGPEHAGDDPAFWAAELAARAQPRRWDRFRPLVAEPRWNDPGATSQEVGAALTWWIDRWAGKTKP